MLLGKLPPPQTTLVENLNEIYLPTFVVLSEPRVAGVTMFSETISNEVSNCIKPVPLDNNPPQAKKKGGIKEEENTLHILN